jgi:hypothetical protein
MSCHEADHSKPFDLAERMRAIRHWLTTEVDSVRPEDAAGHGAKEKSR